MDITKVKTGGELRVTMPELLVQHLKRLKEARQQLAEQIKESETSLKRLDEEIEDLQNKLKEDGVELQSQGES